MSNHGRGECACCERKYAALRIAGTIDGVHMRQRDAYRDILLDLIEELNVAWDTDPMAIREAIDRAEARLWPVGHLHESEPPPERAILLDLIAELTAMLLAGCGAATTGTVQAGDNTPESVNSFWVQTVDGRRIPCVWASGYNRAGLSCDWGQR